MDRNKLKSYAPAARRDFIQAVTTKASLMGLTPKKIEPATIQGDIAIIMGKKYPNIVSDNRDKLIQEIQRDGFDQVMERVAYTWFNRFLALRYMELHSYLDHGFRVLSNRSGRPIPEILENVDKIKFSSLDANKAVELKLAGDKDSELYSMLLVAQCNELHKSMPFLFEAINDETELLLPDNLLRADSILSKLVNEIPEEDWQEVEIIGWLYQFYISEKKDEVIGKVVKSEDIPAATQLFTPNWIVKYMVQNSLGSKWLSTYPNSAIKSKMEYYIEPAEQTPEVKEKLASITPDSLNPEEITLMDPACGSGHILVESYDIFREIYLERGYRTRDIPRLIIEKNLFGLDIDDRAAQLAGFALLMKARGDDPRILKDAPKLNILALQSSEDINANQITNHLYEFNSDLDRAVVLELVSLFKLGKVAGSLIRIPDKMSPKLASIKKILEEGLCSSDLFVKDAAESIEPIIDQALLLANKYDCVVANPPYMGRAAMNGELKDYVGSRYPRSKSDLFAMFIERGVELVGTNDFCAMVTMQSWMFLSSYEEMRTRLLDNFTINCMVHMANMVMGIAFGTAATVFRNVHVPSYVGSFSYVNYEDLNDREVPYIFPVPNERLKSISADNFHKIPGSPIAYWVSRSIFRIFESASQLGTIAEPRVGLQTGDNERFLRLWHEVDNISILFGCHNQREASESREKWFPCNKGGAFRKWYGNLDCIVNWQNDGWEIKQFKDGHGRLRSRPQNTSYYFRPGITWSTISSSALSMRYLPSGMIFETKGSACFTHKIENCLLLLSLTNTKVVKNFLAILSPTLDFHEGPMGRLPVVTVHSNIPCEIASTCIQLSRSDWDSFETSWDFTTFPWITTPLKASTTKQSFRNWESHLNAQIRRMQELETENNRLWIEAYGLQDELTPEVPEDQITLARPDVEKDVKRLISYAIGCMMGRYSLDEPGLIYAHSGNEGFDSNRYKTFPADDDGIIPVTDAEYFKDDASKRIEEFIKTVWGPETLEENLRFVAEALTGKKNTDSREAIRKYLSSNFCKDHLQTYKNRPIYWLFSSGKLKAFECLVYLHRYNSATLSRMRTEYVTKLQGMLSGRIQLIEKDIASASKGSSTKLRKEQETLQKKLVELNAFDDNLRHYADMNISLDLDDGVKVNYGKFGDLLAEVNKVTGKK